MKIGLLGASGRVGQEVIANAEQRGQEINALIHQSNPLDDTSHPNVTTYSGDVHDPEIIDQFVHESDVIISTLGSWRTPHKDVLESAMENIIPAMRRHGVSRIVTLTGRAAHGTTDKPRPQDTLERIAFSLLAPRVLKDARRHLSLLESSGLDWTCVRAPRMVDSFINRYELNDQAGPLTESIPRAAVARCLVTLATSQSTNHFQATPFIHPHQQ